MLPTSHQFPDVDEHQRQVSEEEQKLRFKHLAEATVKDQEIEPSKVCAFLTKYLEGRYSERHIRRLLDEKYKGKQGPEKTDMMSDSTREAIEAAEKKAEETKERVDKLSVRHSDNQREMVAEGCLCPDCRRHSLCW